MQDALLPLPLGIQTFRLVREKGMVYVDKTPFIKLLLSSYRRIFLSRPRRFGKSLFLSTLESYFKGEEELFEGLSVTPGKTKLPVIRLDLSIALTDLRLEESLIDRVRAVGREFGIEVTEDSPPEAFSFLIRAVAGKGRCVVLIDEYDKPVTDALGNDEVLRTNISVLRTFYSVIKAEDALIDFCFITGVSRFSKVSIFSGINNLKDISLLPKFASLCGYTREEVESCFRNWIDVAAAALSVTPHELLELLEEQYNGYRFSSSAVTVFNPISLLNALSDHSLNNYWYETATPSFLIEKLKEDKREPQLLDDLPDIQLGLEPVNASLVSIEELLYQTGYLTIKEVKQELRKHKYTLGWPNREVRESFYDSLLKEYSTHKVSGAVLSTLTSALLTKDLKSFFDCFNTILATVPYTLFTNRESYYHSLLHVVLQVSGLVVHSEKLTSVGRIDLVCETTDLLYIFECKLDEAVDYAIEQIGARRYAAQYKRGQREVVLVGVCFSGSERSVTEWEARGLA